MSVDALLGATYHRSTYNCVHFFIDAWKHITGQDLSSALCDFLGPPTARRVVPHKRHSFTRLTAPVSPCLALMVRPRSAPHVGLYRNGRILHLHENGVEYQPVDVASRGFKHVRFYSCL